MTESCRLITTEQYQEYLKLKEEHKPLSWEELKEEAKKLFLNTEIDSSFIIINETFWFDENGDFGITNEDGSYKIVANDRTPDQMLAIMKALQ